MITKEQLKAKIDGLDEQYLDILDKIIQALTADTPSPPALNWSEFVSATYGSLVTPIERGPQGSFEVREPLA